MNTESKSQNSLAKKPKNKGLMQSQTFSYNLTKDTNNPSILQVII